MLGAIAGDIIGSVYEKDNLKTKEFPLFHIHSRPTDDTILTIATAEVVLGGNGNYTEVDKTYCRRYPYAGYGRSFYSWAHSNFPTPYNSFGNGAAMPVSPIGFAYHTLEMVLQQAERSAAVTHDHPEGIKGAQATASAIFLARQGKTKQSSANTSKTPLVTTSTLPPIKSDPSTSSMSAVRVRFPKQLLLFWHQPT